MRLELVLLLGVAVEGRVGPSKSMKIPSGSYISLDNGRVCNHPACQDIAFGVPDMMGNSWSDYCDEIDCDDGVHNALESNVIKFVHGAAEYDITKFHSIAASDLHGDSSFATTYVDGAKKTETDVFYCTRDKKGYLYKVKFLHGSNSDRQLIHYEALVAPPSTAPTAAPTIVPTPAPTVKNMPTTAPTLAPTKSALCAHVSCEYKTTKFSPKVPMMVVHADPDALTADHKCGWKPAAKKCECFCSLIPTVKHLRKRRHQGRRPY